MSARLVETVLDVIADTGTARRVLLSSFDHRDIAQIANRLAAAPAPLKSIARGILVSTPLHRPGAYLAGVNRAQTFHVSAPGTRRRVGRLPTLSFCRGAWSGEVAELRSARIPVLVYTVNDTRPSGLAEHLAVIGVDGLFTDDPAGMKILFA